MNKERSNFFVVRVFFPSVPEANVTRGFRFRSPYTLGNLAFEELPRKATSLNSSPTPLFLFQVSTVETDNMQRSLNFVGREAKRHWCEQLHKATIDLNFDFRLLQVSL